MYNQPSAKYKIQEYDYERNDSYTTGNRAGT